MKKTLILLLSTILLVCTFMLFACDGQNPSEHVCEWGSQIYYDQTCHYQKCVKSTCSEINVVQQHDWQVIMQDDTRHYYKCMDNACGQTTSPENHEYELNLDDTAMPFQATKVCACGHNYEVDFTTVTPQSAQHTLDNIYDSTIVQLSFGNYESLRITNKSDVIIVGGDFVTVKLVVVEGVSKNIMFYNVKFDFETDNANYANSGLIISGTGDTTSIDKFVVKNCTFTNSTGIRADGSSVVKEAEIVNNKFLNLTWCNINGNRTAIKLYNYNKLTLDSNVFDGVKYDALQTSTSKQDNVVTITNNSFKNVGHIVLYFSYKNSASVNISNNVFYKEVSTVNPNVGLRAESGLYIYQAGSSSITLGANTWEEIPEISDLNFHNVNVNLSEQRTIGE